jgi:hypothetical protein
MIGRGSRTRSRRHLPPNIPEAGRAASEWSSFSDHAASCAMAGSASAPLSRRRTSCCTCQARCLRYSSRLISLKCNTEGELRSPSEKPPAGERSVLRARTKQTTKSLVGVPRRSCAPHGRTGGALVSPMRNEPIAPAHRPRARRRQRSAPLRRNSSRRIEAQWTRSLLLPPANRLTCGAELATAPVRRDIQGSHHVSGASSATAKRATARF